MDSDQQTLPNLDFPAVRRVFPFAMDFSSICISGSLDLIALRGRIPGASLHRSLKIDEVADHRRSEKQ
jgi:hypothetical protein